MSEAEFDWSLRPRRPVNSKDRLPIIVKGLSQGRNHQEIGDRCGVSRRTIYNDRSGLDAQILAQELLDLQLADIAKLARAQDTKAMGQAMHFRDRLLQKLIPRKIISEGKTEIMGEMEVKTDKLSEAILADYVGVIVDIVMEREAEKLNSDPLDEDTE